MVRRHNTLNNQHLKDFAFGENVRGRYEALGWDTYFVEAPSTTNELIMAHYLLEKAKTDRERRLFIQSKKNRLKMDI